MSDLRETFEEYCHQLDTKAQQLRQGTQIAKATGIASTALGCVGLISTGLGALPVFLGLGVYGFGVLREKSTTGRLQPLPWSQASGGKMAATTVQHEFDESVDFVLTDYDHLSTDDKADYTLMSVLAPVIVPLIENATPVQQERWLTGARRTLIKYHADVIVDPEAMAPALYGSHQSFRGAFAKNLPEDMQQRIAPEVLASAGDRRDILADDVYPVQAVGNHTRLTAVDVASSSEDDQQHSLADETLKALKAYVQEPKNLVVVASGGAGKGMTLANLTRYRYEANTAFRAIWFDPKNDPDEAGYMAHSCIKAIRFSAAKMPGEMVVQKVRDMMNAYREMCAKLPPKTPVWLILDEWYFVLSVLQQHDTDALNEVIGMLRSTVSLLDAEHKHIVIVGQSPNLDDLLPGQGGLMANLNTLCLFKRDSSGIKLMEKAGQTGVMPRKMATADRLYAAAAQSPRNRAMFFGDRLWPAPELTNYGNYDRDRAKHLGRAAAVAEQPEPTRAIAQVREFNPDDIQVTPGARQQLAAAFAESNTPAGGTHPKVTRFAEVVTTYFASNPGKESVGLSQIINSNAKLKKARSEGHKDAIEKLVRQANTAGLIRADEGESGFTIYNPVSVSADGLDFDF